MYKEVIHFWFKSIDPSCWWKNDPLFDKVISKKFGQLYAQAANCELVDWRKTSHGRLAEIIVLDQFSRNIFRNTPKAFASDTLALALAQEAIFNKSDEELEPVERSFLYMPFMHSESKWIHELALNLYQKNGIEQNLQFEIKHKEIIDRFGRYPHRNTILGRASTTEELEFLKQPGSSF